MARRAEGIDRYTDILRDGFGGPSHGGMHWYGPL